MYTLSIALVTRNRTDSLERTLISLSKLSIQPYEIIISDDSDNQCELKFNEILAKKYSCKYILGPQKGLYANRNHVLHYCSGTHIRTMDDDHEFPEGHFASCLQAIKDDPNAIWTIGEFLPSDKMALPVPIPGQLHPRGFSFPPQNLDDYYGISCGASIYPRKVIDDKLFNYEYYKFGIMYLEYGARLKKYGYSIKNISTTYVIHHYDENTRSITSFNIINSARVFSILMLSFKHRPTIYNMLMTVFQISFELLIKRYSFKIFKEALSNFNRSSN